MSDTEIKRAIVYDDIMRLGRLIRPYVAQNLHLAVGNVLQAWFLTLPDYRSEPVSQPKEWEPDSRLFMPIADLKIGGLARNTLRDRLSILVVGELIAYSARDLLHCPKFGRKSLDQVQDALAQLGLKLASQDRFPCAEDWFMFLDQRRKQ